MKTCYFYFLLFMVIGFIQCKNDQNPNAQGESEYFEDYDAPINKWGYIDTDGEYIIEAKYDATRPFDNGIAIANLEGKWGYIDKKGNAIIPHQFRAAFQFQEGLARIQNFSKKYGFINKSGELVIPDTLALSFDFNSGLARTQQGNLYGYIDQSGRWQIEPIYNSCSNFKEGYASVNQYGYAAIIDTKGEMVIPFSEKFDKLYLPTGDFIKGKKNKQYYYKNLKTDSQWSGPYQKISIHEDEGETKIALKRDNKWLISNNESLIETHSDYLQYANHDLWIYENDKFFGLLNSDGKIILSPTYKTLYPFNEGMAQFEKDGLWGFIDTTSQVAIQPIFPLVWSFSEGKARMISGGLIGYIDKDGDLAFKYGFTEAKDFSDGLAQVQE